MELKKNWWKYLTAVLLVVVFIYGFLGDVPARPVLNETIRNLYFHVTMWFAMFILTTISLVYSIIHLSNGSSQSDIKAASFAHVGLFLGILGIITGAIWVNYTWNGDVTKIVLWVKEDIKLNGAAMSVLIYMVYFVLRSSITDDVKRGRFSAVFNIFAFVMLMMFTMVLPRMSGSSLHPGNGGNPGFNMYDVSSSMRPIFYSAIIAWSLLGVWIASLRVRYTLLK